MFEFVHVGTALCYRQEATNDGSLQLSIRAVRDRDVCLPSRQRAILFLLPDETGQEVTLIDLFPLILGSETHSFMYPGKRKLGHEILLRASG